MMRSVLSIFVVLVAVLVGVFVYEIYLPLSPEISAEDSLILISAFNAFFWISSVGERLGISPRYKTMRFLTKAPDLIAFNPESINEVKIIEDTAIAGVPVRIYRPKKALVGDKGRPGLIYFHGGGLVMLAAKSMLYNKICSRFSNTTQAVVISVEYRQAPEHPFPIPFQDCYAVVAKVLEEPEKFGIAKGKIAMGGDSSGGLLAAGISVELAKEKRANQIAAQVLIYPWLQLIDATCLPSYQDYTQGFLLTREQMAYYTSLVATGKPDLEKEIVAGNVSKYFMNTKYWEFLEFPENSRKCNIPLEHTVDGLPAQFLETVQDSRLSPLLADSLEGLPPTFITIAEYDVLSDEGSLFARRLKKSGVSVVAKTYKTYHGFINNIYMHHTTTPMASEAMQDMTNFLNSAFSKNST